MWTREMLTFWRYMLSPFSETKSILWVSFCEYIDLCFERTVERKIPPCIVLSKHAYIYTYCDEMPEGGIEESFPRQRTEAPPL
jgi:hypothetical protein